jgi:DNA invertase Pin-like site-specific DNA recombinase
MRVALYARVSTNDQTVAPQVEALRSYGSARGLQVVGEFVDEGVSGSKDRRPALDEMLAAAHRREFDAVACVKLDRLARSVRHLTTLAAEFEALGVDLVVVDQQIDTSTPSGRFLFHTLGAVAELERDLIRERVAAGIKSARKRGVRFGRPSVLDDGQRARARRLRAAGHSIRAIAKILGVSKSAVSRELSRNSSSR